MSPTTNQYSIVKKGLKLKLINPDKNFSMTTLPEKSSVSSNCDDVSEVIELAAAFKRLKVFKEFVQDLLTKV